MNQVVPPMRVSSMFSSPLMKVSLLGVIVVAVWWSNTHAIDAVLALKGFSPIAWVYQIFLPGNFALDFPNGAENYRLSAFMHVYPIAYRLGISPEALLPVVVAFEILLLSAALYALCRVLLPDAPLAVPTLVILYSLASTARDINLANFPQPYILGQYYNVADALRLLGLAMVLRGRLLFAAALLGASFATHPTMGMMGVACAAAMQMTRPREMLTRRFVFAVALFLVIACGWLYVQFGGVTVSGGRIPPQDWLEMTRMFNFHWYSVDRGFFSSKPRDIFLPFLSFLLLLAYYWPKGGQRNEINTKALAGILATLGLSLAGLAISVFVPVPFLIKLALHRANDLVLFIGLVYVVNGLWRDLTADNWWQRMAAATILVSPWFVRPFPLLVSVALVSPAWLRAIGRRNASPADWIVTAVVLGAVLVCAIYFAGGVWMGLSPLTFFPEQRMLWWLALFLLLGALFARWFGRHAVEGLAVAMALAFALSWMKDKAETRDVARGRDYMDAQVWAREHTPNSALFMTDPTIYYGWRDYSRRSSFGNLREWLHTSWLYDANYDRYMEGRRRFGEFNIDLQPYLHARPPDAAQIALTMELRKRYYDASDEWRINLAKRYSIDFFVFQKKFMRNASRLRIVYENDHFMICAVK